MNTLKDFPSYIDRELNLPPPGTGIDHLEDSDGDDSDSDSNDESSDRYELWTFRIPVGMKLEQLDGVEIDLEAATSSKTNTGGGMKIHDGKFVVLPGEAIENENLRVLVPNRAENEENNDDSSDSDSDSNKETKPKESSHNQYLLHTSSKKFTKHFNVRPNILRHRTEAQLAPAQGPDPVGVDLRHAYAPIAQRSGLKRRWMPLGIPHARKEVPPKLVTLGKKKPVSDAGNASTSTQPTSPEVVTASDTENDPQQASMAVKKQQALSPEKSKRKKKHGSKIRPGISTPTKTNGTASPEKTKTPSSSSSKRPPNPIEEVSTPTGLVTPPPRKKVKSEHHSSSKAEKKAAKKAKKASKKAKRDRKSGGGVVKKEKGVVTGGSAQDAALEV